MTILEYVLIPCVLILMVVAYMIERKRNLTASVVHELQGKDLKQVEHIAKQMSIITLLRDNRCGNHVFDIGDKVLILSQINGLSHKITEIFIKKNREPFYTCRKGDAAVRVPEHLVKLFEQPAKD